MHEKHFDASGTLSIHEESPRCALLFCSLLLDKHKRLFLSNSYGINTFRTAETSAMLSEERSM